MHVLYIEPSDIDVDIMAVITRGAGGRAVAPVFSPCNHRLNRERDWKRKLPRIISASRRGLIEAVYL